RRLVDIGDHIRAERADFPLLIGWRSLYAAVPACLEHRTRRRRIRVATEPPHLLILNDTATLFTTHCRPPLAKQRKVVQASVRNFALPCIAGARASAYATLRRSCA